VICLFNPVVPSPCFAPGWRGGRNDPGIREVASDDGAIRGAQVNADQAHPLNAFQRVKEGFEVVGALSFPFAGKVQLRKPGSSPMKVIPKRESMLRKIVKAGSVAPKSRTIATIIFMSGSSEDSKKQNLREGGGG
jgi:hypothetical protein